MLHVLYDLECYLPLCFYRPRHEVGIAGIVLKSIAVSVCLYCVCLLGICLQIVNSFSISGMDEAMLFKFGKWVEYGRVHPGGEKFPLKGVWSGSLDPFKNFKPLQYFWNG